MLDGSARVTADICDLLGEKVVPPWAGQIRLLEGGTAGQGPADDRPIEAIAAEIVRATSGHDEGDGGTDPDPGEGLRRFVGAVAAASARERDSDWLGGLHEYIPDAGPVPSSRFL